ncbi:AAA family ATPase [Corynebacterium sanguinis]|uniref:McrB family protein n=1 Tax=Corynebacterium sanguinis TaxID=2594913 RepID=UPI0021AFADC2|nr:AAA family ATPase [Corynebacterium sanguinis]MCT1665079.1 AAA family ATPase [Corynebacterium sanguinis]
MQIFPKPAQDPDPVSLRLKISPSVRDPKKLIAASIAIFCAMDEPAEVSLHKVKPDSTIAFQDVLLEKLRDWFADPLRRSNLSTTDLDKALESNPLKSLQIEPLQVALELIWSLGSIAFSESRGIGAERTGGSRFPKVIAFNSNMDILAALTKSNEIEYKTVLLSWLGISIPGVDTAQSEDLLKRVLAVFSETAIFKIRSEGTDTVFRTSGIYDQLIEHGGAVSIRNDDGKGPVRILNSILVSDMHPFLKKDRNGSADMITSSDDVLLKEYAERVNLMLGKSVRVIRHRDHGNEPSSTGPQATVDISDANKHFEPEFPRNILFYGVPGSGKSYQIKEIVESSSGLESRVVFHPDYTYSDFVGQILPKTDGHGSVSYRFNPGPFTSALKSAINNPTRNFFLIIEEINRANAPAVFGDLFQLLDRKLDGSSSYAIDNQNIAEEIFGNADVPVSLPSNLFLLATMNSSDQNVYTLDTAFQRRWTMRLVPNDFTRAIHSERRILDTSVTWEKFATTVNETIAQESANSFLSEDRQLGAYFITEPQLEFRDPEKLDSDTESGVEFEFMNAIFGETVVKYLWDDAFKFNREVLFDSRFKTLQDTLDFFNSHRGNTRFAIFVEEIRKRLQISEDEILNDDLETTNN